MNLFIVNSGHKAGWTQGLSSRIVVAIEIDWLPHKMTRLSRAWTTNWSVSMVCNDYHRHWSVSSSSPTLLLYIYLNKEIFAIFITGNFFISKLFSQNLSFTIFGVREWTNILSFMSRPYKNKNTWLKLLKNITFFFLNINISLQ